MKLFKIQITTQVKIYILPKKLNSKEADSQIAFLVSVTFSGMWIPVYVFDIDN